MVTPLSTPDALDLPGLERLIEHMISGGVAGLFILGTTGEGPLLSQKIRRELIQGTCRQVARRLPVLVCVNDTAFAESASLALFSAEQGADAIVAAPPCYLPLGQPELVAYYDRLAAVTPLPLFLYNFPALTKTTLELETVRQLAKNARIVGIKDSSGNMICFHKLLRAAEARADWTVLMGPDELLAESILAGGHGGVNAGANVLPELYVGAYRAAAAGDLARAREFQRRIHRFTAGVYEVGPHSSAIIKGIKCALALRGICKEALTQPYEPFAGPERQRIEAVLGELNRMPVL